MNKLAIVFAGQGSQYLGMGLDFIEKYPKIDKKIDESSKILGYNVEEVLQNDEKIHLTKYTQPLVLLTSLSIYEALKDLEPNVSALAGFSLGEYSALYAAEVFDFKQIVALVQKRAELMAKCSLDNPGSMAAIIGLSENKVKEACQQASYLGVVVPANYNLETQVVISGEQLAVKKACEIAKNKGAKRTIELKVSGAFHSPLMKCAGTKLLDYLDKMEYQKPRVDLYLNTTANTLITNELYYQLEKQIQSPIYFSQMIKQMIKDGITHFIEIGPGKVLSSLIKKIDFNVTVTNINTISDLDNVKGWLKTYGLNK